jgi:hypothetical protein
VSAFLFVAILPGFEDVGIAANWGIAKKDCHIVAHFRLGPQRLGSLQLDRRVHDGHWVNKLHIFKQQAYLLNISGILVVTFQFEASFIVDTLVVKDLGRSLWSGSGSCSSSKPALLKN